jgi:hypothetical protein
LASGEGEVLDDATPRASFGELSGVLEVEMGITEAQAPDPAVDPLFVAAEDVGQQRRLAKLVAHPKRRPAEPENVRGRSTGAGPLSQQNQHPVWIAQPKARAAKPFGGAEDLSASGGPLAPVPRRSLGDGKTDLLGLPSAVAS